MTTLYLTALASLLVVVILLIVVSSQRNQRRIQRLKEELEQLNAKYTGELVESESIRGTLESSIQKLKEELGQLNAKYKDLTDLEKAKSLLSDELNQLKISRDQIFSDNDSALKKLNDEYISAKTIFDSLNTEIQKLEENIVEPKIIKYEPNQATFSTNPKNNSLLFLSDAYDTDWHSYIDGKKSKILRADYALRAVAIPAGEHTVDFKYQPKAFVIGALVSMSSILILIVLSIHFARKKQF